VRKTPLEGPFPKDPLHPLSASLRERPSLSNWFFFSRSAGLPLPFCRDFFPSFRIAPFESELPQAWAFFRGFYIFFFPLRCCFFSIRISPPSRAISFFRKKVDELLPHLGNIFLLSPLFPSEKPPLFLRDDEVSGELFFLFARALLRSTEMGVELQRIFRERESHSFQEIERA